MFVNYFFLFTLWRDFRFVDDGYRSTANNDAYECSVGENTKLSEAGDVYFTLCSAIPILDSGFSDDKSVT